MKKKSFDILKNVLTVIFLLCLTFIIVLKEVSL